MRAGLVCNLHAVQPVGVVTLAWAWSSRWSQVSLKIKMEKVEGLKEHLRERLHLQDPNSSDRSTQDCLCDPKNVKELQNTLSRPDANPNALDCNGCTALHCLAKRLCKEAPDLLYTFLTESEADVNMSDESGNTVLHIAVQVQDIDFIKILLAFGADINPLNQANKTPLDLCMEKSIADKITALLKECGALRSKDIDPDAPKPEPVAEFVDTAAREDECSSAAAHKQEMHGDAWSTQVSKRLYEMEYTLSETLGDVTSTLSLDTLDKASSVGFQIREMRMLQRAGSRILSLDGGGMRTLIQLEILDRIEKYAGKKITELFDWIIGTSGGGVIALMLVHAKLSVSEVRKIFHKMKDPVFGKSFFSKTSSTEAYTAILQETFGSMTMDEVKFPRVLITGVNKTYAKLRLEFFSNDTGIDPDGKNRLVWKVARYTSAAPTYFDEMDNYVDGGVLANNPSIRGLTEMQRLYFRLRQKLPIAAMVSLGSGIFPKEELGRTDYQNILFFGRDWKSGPKELKNRISNFATMLGNSIADSEDDSLSAESACVHQGIDYYRFSPDLEDIVPTGETSRDKLVDMVMCVRRSESLRKQVDQLVLRLHFYAVANQKMARRIKKHCI